MSIVDAIKRYLTNTVSSTSVRFFNVRTDGQLLPSSSTSLSALGTTQGTAAGIISQVSVVSGGGSARATITGVRLPAVTTLSVGGASNLQLGMTWTVRNAVTTSILVYPPVGGTINALAQNAGWAVQPGDNIDFILTGGLASAPTYTTKGVPGNGPSQVIAIPNGAAFPILNSDVGTVFSVAQQTATCTIQLPIATQYSPGATITFVLNTNADGTHLTTITPNAADGILSAGYGSNSTQAAFFKTGTVGATLSFTAVATAGCTIILKCTGQSGANAWLATCIGAGTGPAAAFS